MPALSVDAGAELPDCMCNLDAFDTMARLLDDGVGINLENLLAGKGALSTTTRSVYSLELGVT